MWASVVWNQQPNEVNTLRRACFLLIVGAICLNAFQAQAQIKWDAAKFIPLSEVKPGMRGKAYTVFSGTTVEEFEFKVVSIEYNFQPNWHVIWVEAIGKNFEYTGVAGGMSGSPGYIDGRLMGALSLGYFNQRERSNIVGFTPIELMVDVTQRGMQPNLSYRGGSLFNFGSDTVWDGADLLLPLDADKKKRQGETLVNPLLDSVESARLPMPITLSGLPVQAISVFKPFFDKYRLTPIQGAGGGAPVKTASIEPGQVAGVEFARGDFTAFSYGTMTYIENNQVVCFGHPMFGEGNVNLPLSGGYVHFILPSITRSFKVASATQPIGTLVQDRQTAIAGVLGSHPSFISVDADIQTIDGKSHAMHFEVLRHRDFSALLTMVGVLNLISGVEMSSGDHAVRVDTKISLKDQPELVSREIVRRNVYSSSGSPGLQAALSLSPIASLIDNQYKKVDIESVKVGVKIEDKRKTAAIEGIRINKDAFRPGEAVEVAIRLRPYLEEPMIQTAHITIPEDTPEGLITLLVISASSYETWQQTRAPLNYQPTNINQLIQLLQRQETNTDIILELFAPNVGMTVRGQEFPELPVSVLSVMGTPTQSGDSGYTRGTTLHVEKAATPYVVSGMEFLRFTVDRNAP
jgi:hypothetical protein